MKRYRMKSRNEIGKTVRGSLLDSYSIKLSSIPENEQFFEVSDISDVRDGGSWQSSNDLPRSKLLSVGLDIPFICGYLPIDFFEEIFYEPKIISEEKDEKYQIEENDQGDCMNKFIECKDLEERNLLVSKFFELGYWEKSESIAFESVENIIDLYGDSIILTYNESHNPIINRADLGDEDFLKRYDYERDDKFFREIGKKPSKLVLGLGFGLLAGAGVLYYKLRG